MQPHEKLIVKAAALARSSPQVWADFLLAFGEFSEVHRNNLIKSAIEPLQVNQGRAQMCDLLFRELSIAVERADEIAKKGNNK